MTVRSAPAEARPRADGGGAVAAPAVAVVVGILVATGVVLRFVTTSPLWLDEALSVNIARLPLSAIPEALRHDGHPPLYYFLLHGWMDVFGQGDVAVRALSGLFALVTLPLAWIAGRRRAGRLGALSVMVVIAVSPYAVRYGTETRMYSMVMVLVLAGYLLVEDALRSPTGLRLAAIAVLSGALLLTHYWAFWLVVAVVLVLAVFARRQPPAGRVAVAVVAGSVFFLPWVPSLLEQAAHTGTPWAPVVRPTSLVALTLTDFGGGDHGEATLLAIALSVLVLLALTARALGGYRLEIDLRTVPGVRPEAVVVALTVAIASVAGYVTATTFASRYAAAIFPLFALLAGVGLARLEATWSWAVAAGVVIALGLAGSGLNVTTDRTQAGVVAAAINAGASPGDAVVFCPDQLGPAVDRLLRVGSLDEVTYPSFGAPQRVDWQDYAERNEASDPAAFVGALLDRVPATAAIWVVASPTYRTLEGKCEAVVSGVQAARPGGANVVQEDGDTYFEHAGLWRFPP